VSTPQERLQAAIAQHRAGDYVTAELGYAEHLRQYPDDPSGLHFLGLLRTHQGRTHEAIELIRAALNHDAEYVDAWNNLGIAYFHARDFVRGEECCRRAIELAPRFAHAWGNLAMCLRARDANQQALEAWGRALELEPNMRSAAIPYGQLLYRLNRLDEAREFYRRWLQAVPGEPIAEHMLAALGGGSSPVKAADDYVRTTFDDFAESFDLSLKRLGYRAPELLFAAVEGFCSARTQQLSILDLGCGTGLCAPLFTPVARRLVGVDLSGKMLAKAAQRGGYHQLNLAELTEYLSECRERFDVVLAADVLCYCGDLAACFAGVHNVLNEGGVFACTLEAAPEDSQAPFSLQPHGRYQHAKRYVEEALATAGLRVRSLEQHVLRQERGDAVAGLVVCAELPAKSTA
jgi:predicted TPR repeat methyltransferase